MLVAGLGSGLVFWKIKLMRRSPAYNADSQMIVVMPTNTPTPTLTPRLQTWTTYEGKQNGISFSFKYPALLRLINVKFPHPEVSGLNLYHNVTTTTKYPDTCDAMGGGNLISFIQDMDMKLFVVPGNLEKIYSNYYGGNIHDPKQAITVNVGNTWGYKLLDNGFPMLGNCGKTEFFIRLNPNTTLIVQKNIELEKIAEYSPEFAKVLSQTVTISDTEADNLFNRIVDSIKIY